MNKKEILNEKNRLEKKKLLLQLSSEIEELEKKIKNSKKENDKIKTLRTFKITLRVIQAVLPYTAVASITFGIFSLLNSVPFFIDNKKQKLNILKELDSKGNIRYEEQYRNFEETESVLSYYGKWNIKEDGMYERIIKEYSLHKIKEEEIMRILQKEKLSLEDVLGKPLVEKKETKNNLNEEEKNEKEFLKAIIYDEKNDDYIIIKESIGENIVLSVLYTVLTILFEVLTINYRQNISDFDFSRSVENIKRKYPKVDTDILIKKLEIKRENYDKMTR